MKYFLLTFLLALSVNAAGKKVATTAKTKASVSAAAEVKAEAAKGESVVF